MIGFAILGLLGVALVVGISGDDDDDQASAVDQTPELAQGTDDGDLLDTDGGNDTVFAGDGDDIVLAGDGNDRVFGGAGEDLLTGEAGNDFLRGGADDDALYGGAGEDTLNGDLGDDILDGTDIFDVPGLVDAAQTAAAEGRDLSEDDVFSFLNFDADTGQSDELNGGQGDDILIAGGNDVVITGLGNDSVELGDWIEPGALVTIEDFDTAEDVIVYNYEGDTAPDLTFGEVEGGTPALLVDGEAVAIFENTQLSDLLANTTINTVSIA